MRGNVYGRLERMEGRLKPDTGVDMTQPVHPDDVAVLDAYSDLKSAMADKHYRGGVPIPPINRAAEVYGPRYTQEQFLELAIRTGLEDRGYTPGEIDERVPGYLELFAGIGDDLHIGAVPSEEGAGGATPNG
jgi:hypothetical protein